jgi:polar amino acid transport system permease protein
MSTRQKIANALIGVLLVAAIAALSTALFGALAAHSADGTSNLNKVWAYREALGAGFWTTLKLSAVSLLGSSLVGLLLMLAQRSALPVLRLSARVFLEFVRDTPLLVHLLFGYFVIFAPVLARPLSDRGFDDKLWIGVLLLSLFEGAYLAEILRGAVESIAQTQWDAARAVGFSPVQVYRYVIFPQALRRALPAIAGLFVSLVKDSSLLNVIGVQEYFYNTKNFISRSYAGLEGYVPLAIGYLIITVPIALFSRWLERRFRHET